jgi:hypothetical protein
MWSGATARGRNGRGLSNSRSHYRALSILPRPRDQLNCLSRFEPELSVPSCAANAIGDDATT